MEKNKNRGFSLIEVIVAMSILVVVSIPILNTFNDSIRLNMQSKERQRAVSVDQSVVEGLKKYSLSEIRKNFQGAKTDFDIIQGYDFEKNTELLNTPTIDAEGKTVNSLIEMPNNSKNGDDYYYAICGVEDGKDKYDVLVTLDAEDERINDINGKLPKLINVKSNASVILDNSGKAYDTESYIESAVKYFGSKTDKKVSEDDLQCKTIIKIENSGKDGYSVFAKIIFSIIPERMTTLGISHSDSKYTRDNVGYTVVTMGYPKNIYLLYYPVGANDTIEVDYELDDDPGTINLDIAVNKEYAKKTNGSFEVTGQTPESSKNWKDYVNVFTNCTGAPFNNMAAVGAKEGMYADDSKVRRMYAINVEVYQYVAGDIKDKFKKRVSSLKSSIVK